MLHAPARRSRDGNPVPEIHDNRHPGLLPAQTGRGHPAIGRADVLAIGEMTVMRHDLGAPTLDIFGPGRTLAEHDLVVAGIGIDKNLETMRRQGVGKEACAAYIDEQIGSACHRVEGAARHAVAGIVQMQIMPMPSQLRSVAPKKVSQEPGRISGIIGHPVVAWMVGPAPGVFMIEHIVAEARQTDDILQVIPSDTAHRILGDHAGDDDP